MTLLQSIVPQTSPPRCADRTRQRGLCVAVWWLAGSIVSVAAAAQPGSLAEMLDFGAAPRSKPWSSWQAAGHDRGGGFYDSGNFLRIEPGRRYVLLDVQGPGIVDRMWFTYKGRLGSEPYELLIYIDDLAEPAVHANLDELFLGRRAPFVEPLVGLSGNPHHPGRYSYVPLGFRRACRIVLQPTAPDGRYPFRTNSAGESIPHVYYQITYRRLEAGQSPQLFSWELSADDQRALEALRTVWGRRGSALQPKGQRTEVDVVVPAGGTACLVALSGGGTITGLRLKTERPDALALRGYWDGEAAPALDTPWGPLFGCADGPVSHAAVSGLWLGYDHGTYYNFLPMPFARSAILQIVSRDAAPIRVEGSVDFELTPPHSEDGRLHVARYDHDPPQLQEDYVVLDVRGRGHFVGLVMDRPGHMEGDDRFYVDDTESPALHGTGTEDFFNFAWGLSHVGSFPLHGISRQPGGPTCYRFHLPAAIPFQRRLRITWEHGHDEREGANRHQGRYSGSVFYYLATTHPGP